MNYRCLRNTAKVQIETHPLFERVKTVADILVVTFNSLVTERKVSSFFAIRDGRYVPVTYAFKLQLALRLKIMNKT